MERIGLVNTVIEPFMDYGVSWDNEYFSLHMLERTTSRWSVIRWPTRRGPRESGSYR